MNYWEKMIGSIIMKNISLIICSIIFWGVLITYQHYQFEWYTQYRTYTPKLQSSYDILEKYMYSCHLDDKICGVFPFQQMMANISWAQSIQYVVSLSDKSSIHPLSQSFFAVNALSPYRIAPYTFGQLVLPLPPQSKFSDKQKRISWEESLKLWKRWVWYLCRWIHCPQRQIPWRIGFVYYYYLNDVPNALKWYRFTAQQQDVPPKIAQMPFLIQKEQAKNIEKDVKCLTYSWSDFASSDCY